MLFTVYLNGLLYRVYLLPFLVKHVSFFWDTLALLGHHCLFCLIKEFPSSDLSCWIVPIPRVPSLDPCRLFKEKFLPEEAHAFLRFHFLCTQHTHTHVHLSCSGLSPEPQTHAYNCLLGAAHKRTHPSLGFSCHDSLYNTRVHFSLPLPAILIGEFGWK